MITDRDLLIGAAKAAGIHLDTSESNGGPRFNNGFDASGDVVLDWHNGKTWNPLKRGDDSFDLQVALKMDIAYYGNHVRATINHRYWAVSLVHPDRKTATMRAIVLAAHKLGKDLP